MTTSSALSDIQVNFSIAWHYDPVALGFAKIRLSGNTIINCQININPDIPVGTHAKKVQTMGLSHEGAGATDVMWCSGCTVGGPCTELGAHEIYRYDILY